MSSPTRNTARRRRKPVHTYSIHTYNAEEEKLVQQAIENSKKMTRLTPGAREMKIPLAPIFHPTVEEFEGCPLNYIEKIRPLAQKYGICKIVPPKGWNPPFSVDMESKKKFQTKEQLLHRIQEGISFGDGEEHCASDYLKMAAEQTRTWIEENIKDKDGNPTQQASLGELEKAYWDLVEISHEQYTVEYGNDVDSHEFGSGFPRSERGRGVEDIHAENKDPESDTDASEKKPIINDAKENLPEPKFGTEEFYKETYWNLNNIPNCSGSILKHIKVGINGINVPWLYFGNLFSTFCWHNEDNYLYSINYHHWGAPKCWYGVPGTEKDAEGLEQVFKSYLSMKMRDVPDLMYHITTMFSPRLLQNAKVPVYKIMQYPGEFVITFPMAFHGGFSMGPNAGEAVNFASHDWISHGADASERYRSFARPAVFSQDRLTFTMANHLKEQMSRHNCNLLLEELNRVISEEKRLRKKLLDTGMRDISKDVRLPRNRVDQLDEDSADYDDKRMCFSCKHICFFSCVACECSKSKVSCLRHSHYMCRCPSEKRYMMVWTTEDQMDEIYASVQNYFEKLGGSEEGSDAEDNEIDESDAGDETIHMVPGAEEGMKKNEGYMVDMSETSPLSFIPRNGQLLREEANPAKRININEAEIIDSDGKKRKLYDLTVEKEKRNDEVSRSLESKGETAKADVVEIIDESEDEEIEQK